MKVQILFVVFLGLALGAAAYDYGAQRGPVEPLTPEQRNQKIRELQATVAKLKAAVKRFTTIGKKNVALLESVMNAVDHNRRKCLQLENMRPAPVKVTPLQPIPEKPLEGDPLSTSQISARVHAVDNKVKALIDATNRYISIGKGNIGVMHRFAEASRSGVCGANHYSKCPVGFVHNAVTDSCFREVVGRWQKFSDAQDSCHRMGGHLPRVKNIEGNNALPDLLQLGVRSFSKDENVHSLWLGLQKNDDGVWQWVHPADSPISLNEEGSFKNFDTEADADDKGCAYLCFMSNKWIKASCDTKARVLCEKPINPAPAEGSN